MGPVAGHVGLTLLLTAALACEAGSGGSRADQSNRASATARVTTGSAGSALTNQDRAIDSLPVAARELRDSRDFYRHVRGDRRDDMPRPTRANIESLIAGESAVYQAYLAHLFWGFVYELEGSLDSAQRRYETSLAEPIQGELSYYTHRDLARLALKRSDPMGAARHLDEYLRLLSLEIRNAQGDLAAGDSLMVEYVPSSALLAVMQDDYRHVRLVAAALQAVVDSAGDSADAQVSRGGGDASQAYGARPAWWLKSGIYFGTSRHRRGVRGWWLFVDSAAAWASVYVPPRSLPVCELSNDGRGGYRFTTGAGYRGVRYAFAGTAAQRGFAGQVYSIPGDRRDVADTSELTLTRVHSWTQAERWVGQELDGYYGNVSQTEEGDLGGLELVLLAAPDTLIGTLAFYEGSAGMPYAIKGPALRGSSLTFSIVQTDGDVQFSADIGVGRLVLAAPALQLAGPVLEKRATLGQVATTTYGACPGGP